MEYRYHNAAPGLFWLLIEMVTRHSNGLTQMKSAALALRPGDRFFHDCIRKLFSGGTQFQSVSLRNFKARLASFKPSNPSTVCISSQSTASRTFRSSHHSRQVSNAFLISYTQTSTTQPVKTTTHQPDPRSVINTLPIYGSGGPNSAQNPCETPHFAHQLGTSNQGLTCSDVFILSTSG